MGCGSSKEDQSYSNEISFKQNRQSKSQSNRHHNRNTNNNINSNNIVNPQQPNFEPFLQSKIDPYFNFPEVDDDTYVGKGLKRMKGYVSSITKEELLRKREEFWQTRVEGNAETWQFLQRICEDPEFEHEDIQAYLSATGVIPYKDCINVTYDTFGGLYEIPNYCIHFPSKYDLPENHKEKPKEEITLRFVVRKGMDTLKVENSNFMKVKVLKKFLAKNFPNINVKSKKIRLFFGGKEMEDEKEIWFYNVGNDSIVLLMVRM